MPLGQDVEIPDLLDEKAAKRRNELRKLNKVGKASLVVSADPFLETHAATTEAAYVLGTARRAPKQHDDFIDIGISDEVSESSQDALTQEDNDIVQPRPNKAAASRKANIGTTSPLSPPPTPPLPADVGSAGPVFAKEENVITPPAPLADALVNSNETADIAERDFSNLQKEMSNLAMHSDGAPIRRPQQGGPSRASFRCCAKECIEVDRPSYGKHSK